MAKKRPVVGVVMGSDSDLETMKRCLKQLDHFRIPYEVRVISAHRTPGTAHEYAATAIRRGLKVIIAAAGMSAALGGVFAANTTLPVIGVPMIAGTLGGLDAALSKMQMPSGVPVGCMSIGAPGATNAAIFAAQILAICDEKLARKLTQFKDAQGREVAKKDATVAKSLRRR
jgi:5-(carboxyamino)imidazole ribonucleotide mutase